MDKDLKIIELEKYIDTLQTDLTKLQVQLCKSEQVNKKLQEVNSLNSKSCNNTSSSFALPSEFKVAWEEMVNEVFIDGFGDWLEDPDELILLVKDVFQTVYSSLIHKKEEKICITMKQLGVDEKFKDYLMQKYFSYIFQEFSLDIFPFTEEHWTLLQTKLHDALVQRTNNGEVEEKYGEWIQSEDLKEFFKSMHNLYLHMTLNNPPIEVCFNSDIQNLYKEFSKSAFHCLDGFPKESLPCVIIIPPPMRQGYPYQSIKPSVIIIRNPSEKIREIIEKGKESPIQPSEELTQKNHQVREIKPISVMEIEESLNQLEKIEMLSHDPPIAQSTSFLEENSDSLSSKRNSEFFINRAATTRERKEDNGKPREQPSPGFTETPIEPVEQNNILKESNPELTENLSAGQEESPENKFQKSPLTAMDESRKRSCYTSNLDNSHNSIQENSNIKYSRMTERCEDKSHSFLKQSRFRPSRQLEESYELARQRLLQSNKQYKEHRRIQDSPTVKSPFAAYQQAKSIVMKENTLERLTEEKNKNMPLQPSKMFQTQKEKLKAYQNILKAKLSSIKNSTVIEPNRPSISSSGIERREDYSTIKASFQNRIQELNEKLYKYKNTLKNSDIAHKQQTSTTCRRKNCGLNGSGMEYPSSKTHQLYDSKTADPTQMLRGSHIDALRTSLRHLGKKENTQRKGVYENWNNGLSSYKFASIKK